jgi:FkbM family methyltransferase
MKELIYKIINFFTFGRGLKKTFSGYPVRLPTRYINYFTADYEKQNFDFLKSTTPVNGVVLDIGAHIGLFSCIAAKVVGNNGKVMAFEPTPKTNALLQQTIHINKLTGLVEPRSEAVGDKTGTAVFFASDTVGDNSNSLVSYLEDRTLNGISVPVTTIDIFVKEKGLNRVDFIKLDVEGAEYDAIRGAVETFKKFRPHCILAIHPEPIIAKGDTLENIYDFVVNAGYKVTLDEQALSKEDFCKNKGLVDLHLIPA